jgi:microcystin-dependent protein
MIGTFEGSGQGFEEQKIILWTKPISEIPSGWYICDGNNGTPDLTDKMLRGHGAGKTSAGTTGGENQKMIDQSQMPSHTHSVDMEDTNVGDHDHEVGQDTNKWDGMRDHLRQAANFEFSSYDIKTGTTGYHSHSFSVGSTGSKADIENRPEYKKTVYIMRK